MQDITNIFRMDQRISGTHPKEGSYNLFSEGINDISKALSVISNISTNYTFHSTSSMSSNTQTTNHHIHHQTDTLLLPYLLTLMMNHKNWHTASLSGSNPNMVNLTCMLIKICVWGSTSMTTSSKYLALTVDRHYQTTP